MSIRCKHAFRLWLIGSLLLCVQHAQAEPMSPETMRQILIGKTLAGEYPDGRAWQEKFNKDGTTDYQENGLSISGKLTIKGQHFCFSYRAGSGLVGGCFEIWRRSTNCFDFYGTNRSTGQTAASDLQKLHSLAWSARGWFADKVATCVSEQMS